VVFGKLVGNFSAFPVSLTPDEFRRQLDRQALYIFGLFIARFGLNYINKVSEWPAFRTRNFVSSNPDADDQLSSVSA
jgi:hypothetical protein